MNQRFSGSTVAVLTCLGAAVACGGSVQATSDAAVVPDGGQSVDSAVDARIDAVVVNDAALDAKLVRTPLKHRLASVACDGVRTVPEPTNATNPPSSCNKHADCTQGKNGRCVQGFGWSANVYSCNYDVCQTDSDCKEGPCVCGEGLVAPDVCLTMGNCRVDADCGGSPGFCSPTFGGCGNYTGVIGYACHTPKDECIDDGDCAKMGQRAYCALDTVVGYWKCSVSECAG